MKKLIAILLTLTLIAAAFAACAKTDNDATTNAPDNTAKETTTIDDAKKDKLIMGTNATFPPYEFYDADKIVGIDAEVAALIADKLGMELEIKDMDFNGILAAVSSGTISMGMAGMTVNPDRLKQVNFTTSYAKGVQTVIVKEDSDILSIENLKGKKIGVQEATTGDNYATDGFGEDAIKRYNKGTDAVSALVNGAVDAVIIDNEPAKTFVKNNKGLKLLPTPYADEDYAIAIAKNNDDLLKKVDNALKELIADGSVKKVIDKYIPAE